MHLDEWTWYHHVFRRTTSSRVLQCSASSVQDVPQLHYFDRLVRLPDCSIDPTVGAGGVNEHGLTDGFRFRQHKWVLRRRHQPTLRCVRACRIFLSSAAQQFASCSWFRFPVRIGRPSPYGSSSVRILLWMTIIFTEQYLWHAIVV